MLRFIFFFFLLIGSTFATDEETIIHMKSTSTRAAPTYNYAYQSNNPSSVPNYEHFYVNSMTQDSNANDIICGDILGDLKLDSSNTIPYPSSLAGTGNPIAYVASIKDNVWNWWFIINSTDSSKCADITIDSGDNIYITGYFTGGSATFPSATTISLTDPGYLGYVAKIDKTQKTKWIFNTRTTSGNGVQLNGITIDGSKNTYVAGYYGGQITVGSTSYTSTSPLGRTLVFKLNNVGAYQWSSVDAATDVPKTWPYNYASDIFYDSTSAALYITGSYRTGTMVLGSFTLTYSQLNWETIFVAVLNPTSGAFTNAVSSYGNGWSYDVAQSFGFTVKSGYIYVTGLYRGTMALDTLLTPATTLNSGTALMPWRGFLAAYTTSLAPQSLLSIDADFAWPYSVCAASSTTIALCGSFSGTMAAPPSSLTTGSLAAPFTLIYSTVSPANPSYLSSLSPSPQPYVGGRYSCHCDGASNVLSAYGFDNSGTYGSTTLASTSTDVAVISASF